MFCVGYISYPSSNYLKGLYKTYVNLFLMIMNTKKSWKSPKPVLDLVVPSGLKRAVEEASQRLQCSQAEVVRTALYAFLSDLSLIREHVKKGDSR